jgi:hypothetical protein
VASDGGEVVNDELAAMLDDPAYWSQNLLPPLGPFFQHHSSSLFPRVFSSANSQTYFYQVRTHVFSTDEWAPENAGLLEGTGVPSGWYWPTTWQLEISDFIARRTFLTACDSEGRFYAWGEDPDRSSQNAMGHGPDVPSWDITLGSRTRRYGPTRVFGENAELDEVRFVKCGIGSEVGGKSTTSALTESGVLYMSGSNASGSLGDPSSGPRYYHKPLLGYTWKTYSHGANGIIAIDYLGNAYTWGPSIFAGDKPFGSRFFDVPTLVPRGFIEELTIEHPGSGSWVFLGVDPPQDASGRQATVQFSTNSAGQVTDAWVLEPGSGYLSPPALRFRVLGNGVVPIVSARLFSSSWRTCFSDLISSRGALISEDGYMYTFGVLTVEPYETPVTSPARSTISPRKHLSTRIRKVCMVGDVVFALGEDNDVYASMDPFVFPGMQQGKLRKLFSGDFVDIVANGSAVMVLNEDGRIFGAGQNVTGELGVGDRNPRTTLTQASGGIRAKRLFNGRFASFVALRDQAYDAAGNPVYLE